MAAECIMVQGTMSGVGKSTALRIPASVANLYAKKMPTSTTPVIQYFLTNAMM